MEMDVGIDQETTLWDAKRWLHRLVLQKLVI